METAASCRPAPRSPSCNPRALRLPLVQGMRKVYRDECQSGREYMRSRNTLIVVCFFCMPCTSCTCNVLGLQTWGTCSRVTRCHPLRSSLQPHLTTTPRRRHHTASSTPLGGPILRGIDRNKRQLWRCQPSKYEQRECPAAAARVRSCCTGAVRVPLHRNSDINSSHPSITQ